MDNLLLLAVFLLANRFFTIGPWWQQYGQYDVADIGNPMIVILLGLKFVVSKNRAALLNPVSFLILFYFLLVSTHSLFALFNFHQSVMDTLIAVRHQMYFLSFFLFLLFLTHANRFIRLLNALEIVAIFVVILAIANYAGFPVFHHKWAAGHGIRSGITRAFIPAMGLVSFTALWSFTKWLYHPTDKPTEKSPKKPAQIRLAGKPLFLMAAHFLRQTRMRLFTLLPIICAAIIFKREWKVAGSLLVVLIAAFLVLNVTMRENPMTSQIITGYENITQKTGTWYARYKQILLDVKEFQKHPWLGDGKSAIREHGASWRQMKLRKVTRRTDLGYTSWIKLYGVIGASWLLLFWSVQVYMAIRVIVGTRIAAEKMLATFGLMHLGYLIITFVTLNHFKSPDGILLISLNAALICSLYAGLRAENPVFAGNKGLGDG